MEGDIILSARNLKMYYRSGGRLSLAKGRVRAVDGVSLDIRKGETFGLVGESGCGKSSLGRTILGLYKPNAGTVTFGGEDVFARRGSDAKRLRRRMQLIFQDPSASLNPRRTIEETLSEPFIIHRVGTKSDRPERIAALIDKVGLSSYHLSRYPHEMSGGQKQRVGIARAIALNPEFIVCDEAVSSLDVSIQAQVINLLEDLQKEFGLTYLFISHNLGVVHHISDRVGVMYLGKIVEVGTHDDIYRDTLHPYSQALISALPDTDPERQGEGRILLAGDVPSPVNPPPGCRFHTRCRHRKPICESLEPEIRDAGNGHLVACHLVGDWAAGDPGKAGD